MKSKAVHAARCRHLCHSTFGIGRKYLAVISNYILGVKPDWYGLKIDPCVLHDWDGYKVSRRFRSATYEIAINNPDHVCRGVKAVTVDGNVRRLFRLHL